MELNRRQFGGQTRLFDPGPDQEPQPNLGDLSGAQWHGSDLAGWADIIHGANIPVHSGTMQAADHRGASFYPVWPQNVKGHQRNRWSDTEPYSDPDANRAQMDFEYYRGHREAPSVVQQSAGPYTPESERAAEDLLTGHSIPYENAEEDLGSTSYLSPPQQFKTALEVDRGLATGTGWQPRPHLTRAEMRTYAGLDPSPEEQYTPRKASRDPRLFEEITGRPGKYYAHDQIADTALRNPAASEHPDLLKATEPYGPTRRTLKLGAATPL